MEYRKLISFGKSSFVVSLPKAWIDKQKLKKGDTLYFDEKDNNLVLSTQEFREEEEKEIVINTEGKTINQIQRELIPAYINNFKTIILFGKDIKKNAKEISSIIQNLIALEVMEQTSDKIVAKDFLNMRDLSIINIIRKMDVITRTMIEDCGKMFQEDNYENINYRDKDVNRLSYLVFRAVNYGFRNLTYISKQFKLDTSSLVKYYLLAFHIEAIADEARRIARYMRLIKLSKPKQKIFFEYLNKAKHNYLDTLKAFYTTDLTLAHSIAERKDGLVNCYDKFYLDNRNTAWVGYLVDHLKRMVVIIHKMGRLVYQ